MNDEQNILATIPAAIIGGAAKTLPDAETALDEPQVVQIQHDDRWIRITFYRYKLERGQSTRWFWTAEYAEEINRGFL